VTGLGAVSCFGAGVAPLWENVAAGRCGIVPLRTVAVDQLKFAVGAEWSEFDGEALLRKEMHALADRNAQFALLAAAEAVTQAGLALPEDSAIVTGCCVGGKHIEDASYWDVYGERKPRVHPLTIPKVMANSAASLVAIEHGVMGPVYTVSTACSSANHAIGQAFDLVRRGVVPVALTGGSEAPFVFGLLKAWEAMRVVSTEPCRPFDRDRKGMSLGEGAGMLVLEDLDSARQRGANILAEITGFGMSADAHHITQPSPAGAARAIRMAIQDSGEYAAPIGYVNAHGTGTLANDPAECQAIRLALGASADSPAVSSTKSMHGHALGAAGALEAVVTVMALRTGLLPPTAGLENPDTECNADLILGQAREQRVDAALSSSFAFGGLNAVLAFRRWPA
jgi:nodulation protein E